MTIFILIASLTLIPVTALTLTLTTPGWAPLIPLGILVLTIVILCIFSKSRTKIQKKEEDLPSVPPEEKPIEKVREKSPIPTRSNSLSSLLEEDNDDEETSSVVSAPPQRRNSFESIISEILSEDS